MELEELYSCTFFIYECMYLWTYVPKSSVSCFCQNTKMSQDSKNLIDHNLEYFLSYLMFMLLTQEVEVCFAVSLLSPTNAKIVKSIIVSFILHLLILKLYTTQSSLNKIQNYLIHLADWQIKPCWNICFVTSVVFLSLHKWNDCVHIREWLFN